MKYIILLTMLICGVFASNVYADSNICSSQPSVASGPFTYSYSDGENVHINYNGCDFTGPVSSISNVTYKKVSGMVFNTGNLYKEPDKLTAWPNNEVVYTPAQCAARPPLIDVSMSSYWDGPDGQVYAYYDGCEYMSYGIGVIFPDRYFGSWRPTGRAKPSVTGTGSGPSGTGGGTGPVGPGAGSTPSGSGGGTGGSSGSTPVTGGTGGTSGSSSGSGGTGGGLSDAPLNFNYGSGSSSGSGGTGGSSDSSSGSGGGTPLIFNYGNSSSPGSKPGETTWTSTTPLPAPVPYGEPTSAEIKNYAKDFFIYNRQCGSSCLSYFNTTGGMFTPVTCQDLAFNLNVPHKKPDCRSDDIAWYDKAGNFIEFKYPLTDKARHDIINKLKSEFSSDSLPSGNTPFYPGVTPLPSGSLPVEVTNPVPNFFNLPGSSVPGYHGPYTNLDGLSPFTVLTGILDVQVGTDMAQNQTLSELKGFHNDFNERLNTDNLDSTAKDSVSKLSANLTGLLNGQNVGGEFSEASRLMGQIGNGADSPLLGKFLEKNIIPIVDTHQCVMPVFGRGTDWEFTLSSDKWLKLKQILTFIMYAYTFWCLFDMLTNTGDRK